MKNLNLKHVMTAMLCFMALSLFARDFTYNGLVYTILDEEGFTCGTKSGNAELWNLISGNVVSGYVEVPEVVNDGVRDYKVVEIGEAGFSECDGLVNIRISSSIKKIGKMAFYRCYKLKAIDLPISLEEIGERSFMHCYSLQEIVIPRNVTEIADDAFMYCDSLQRCIMHEGLKRIGNGVFFECESLVMNELPHGLEIIGPYAFCFCTNIEHMDIPDSVKELGHDAFSKNEKLKSIRLSKNIKTIYYSTFVGCNSLESVEFPVNLESIEDPEKILVSQDSHDSGRWEYEDGAFYGCDGLKFIRLPESLSYIGIASFQSCHNLETLVLPTGLNNIGELAFCGCKSLREIIYPVSDPLELPADLGDYLYPSLGRHYGFDDHTYETAMLVVAPGGLEKARKREPWKFFKHIEERDLSGVEGIVSEPNECSMDVYRMDGVRIGDSTDGLPSGLYIVSSGGKTSKIMVP